MHLTSYLALCPVYFGRESLRVFYEFNVYIYLKYYLYTVSKRGGFRGKLTYDLHISLCK